MSELSGFSTLVQQIGPLSGVLLIMLVLVWREYREERKTSRQAIEVMAKQTSALEQLTRAVEKLKE
ncbi:MAG: hypothetical protein AAF415_02225 [Pseudomonadota bacterium]